MILDSKFKPLKAAMHADLVTPALSGAYLNGDKLITTNGRMMAIFPVKRDVEDHDKVIINPEAIKFAQHYTQCSTILLTVGEKYTHVHEEDFNANSVSITCKHVEGPYPNIDKVIPPGEPKTTVMLDAAYLYELAQALGSLQGSAPVELCFFEDYPTTPIRVRLCGDEKNGGVGYIMGIKPT